VRVDGAYLLQQVKSPYDIRLIRQTELVGVVDDVAEGAVGVAVDYLKLSTQVAESERVRHCR